MDFTKVLIIINIFQENFVNPQRENAIENPNRAFQNNVTVINNDLQRNEGTVLHENIIVEDLYDYDDFISEYLSNNITLKLNTINSRHHKGIVSNNLTNDTHNEGISSSNNWDINKRIHKNTNRFYKDVDNKQSSEFALRRLLEILKIFLIVYLILAIPLWCTKGWCCCCLSCKFFKPNKIIEEAKIFLECNPPGVFKHRDGVIHYEPTDAERDCYEKLEHLIKTI